MGPDPDTLHLFKKSYGTLIIKVDLTKLTRSEVIFIRKESLIYGTSDEFSINDYNRLLSSLLLLFFINFIPNGI
jgi:hypothetical protein